jgi:ubiquinone/menaquinone biosynthesis C-methylase UbiE
MIKSDWYKAFFTGMAVDFWIDVVPPELTQTEIAMLDYHLGCRPGDKLLDIPCGNGRHAVALAKKGLLVTGVDFSETFLKEARALATKKKARNVEFVRAEMSQFQRPKAFDGAYCMGNSYGYLDYDQQQSFLESVCQSLKKGKRFVVDASVAAECILPTFEERMWFEANGMKVLIENSYNPSESAMLTEYTFIKNGKSQTKTSVHRLYTVAEILRMFQAAGFKVIDTMGGIENEPFELGRPQFIVVAQKL